MWLLSLDERGGDSYGTYLMKCDLALQEKVEDVVNDIIECFKQNGNHEWSVDEIASALQTRGFENEFIHCVHLDV